jgi:hypothetical protein
MRKFLSLIFILTLLSFISCQDILECIINRHPELPNKTLASAQVNQFYIETIQAEIKNEPMDDNYDYYFSIDGNLPRGIDSYVDYRTIVFEGEPYLAGTYKFTIRLSVEQSYNYSEECENNFNDCDGLCSESTSQVYTIIVN